jgi:predicted N-formylglutamate amidohydrolase
MTLLGPSDPPPFKEYNADSRSGVLFVSDHHHNAVPAALGTLGVSERELGLHIGYDIGIAMVGDHLSQRFGAPLVASGYSRLVIDPNRFPGTPGSIPEVSDGIAIPGNREDAVFQPYHRAVSARIAAMRVRGQGPVLVALHSFTPAMGGKARPWQIGILWNEDGRLARPLIEALGRRPDLVVGDNEPYTARDPLGFTTAHHAEPDGLPHVAVEFRQDLIADPAGAQHWAAVFAGALAEVLDDAPWAAQPA